MTQRTFIHDNRGYKMGAASARCFDDLVGAVGETAAVEIRGEALQRMPGVRVRYPDSPGRNDPEIDIIVEALLVAAQVPESEVPKLARRYRRGSAGPDALRAAIAGSSD